MITLLEATRAYECYKSLLNSVAAQWFTAEEIKGYRECMIAWQQEVIELGGKVN